MSLNPEVLERSFELVKSDSEGFSATFYRTLFERYPAVKPLFVHTAMSEQGKKLFQSLVLVVETLHNPEALTRALHGLGTRHVRYGVLPSHYPMVGDALLSAFAVHLQDAWTPAVSEAWKDAYAAVTQLMLAGTDYPDDILKL
jgi:hemoglobin-like flavoprotein